MPLAEYLLPHKCCVLCLRRAHTERPDCYLLPKWPPRRANALDAKTVQTPSFPQTQHDQKHNTVGTHFIIFEMALGPLWPFAVPNKYIRRVAQHKWTHLNNTTPFTWTSSNSCTAHATSGAPPLSGSSRQVSKVGVGWEVPKGKQLGVASQTSCKGLLLAPVQDGSF